MGPLGTPEPILKMNWYKKAQSDYDEDDLRGSTREFIQKDAIMQELVTKVGPEIDDNWWDKYAETYFQNNPTPIYNEDDTQNVMDKIVGAALLSKLDGNLDYWMPFLLNTDWPLF